MENISGIVQMLGNGFFPIVVCGLMFWYVYMKDKAHKDEINELRKSIDNNTRAIQKLVDKMGGA